MIGSDIALDYTGNTIIENGDFKLEQDSTLSYLNRMLVTAPGSWKTEPSIGIGIQSYLDGDNIDYNIKKLDSYLYSLTTMLGITADITINKNNSTLRIDIVSSDINTTNKAIGLKFNYMNGVITYDAVSSELEQNTSALHIKSSNKYRDRR